MKKEKTFDNTSTTANSKQLEILKTNFPQCFDKNGDFIPHRMQEVVAKDGINFSKESYSLNWLGKSYARLLANEQPLTLLKEDTAHNQKPENINSKNLLIKGDNLEVLKHLRHAYSEQVKMIYIDPPYNTGSDGFVYNDDRKFTLEQLQRLAGIDEDEAQRILDFTASNSNSHSAWLTFIYPRLYIARELLTDDGVIFISIDDNEQAQLKMLCDEVFGEDNFVADFVWKTRQASGKQVSGNNTSIEHEYIFCYQKRQYLKFLGLSRDRGSYKNPDNDARGDWAKHPLDVGSTKSERPNCFYDLIDPDTGKVYPANPNRVWSFSEESMSELLKNGQILFHPNGETKPYLKKFWKDLKSEFKPISSWMDKQKLNIGYNTEGTKQVNKLFDGNKIFDYPKPVSIVKILISQTSSKNSIILDFFAGSGTTADAVMQLNADDDGNRKCISVQLAEPIDEAKNKTAYDFVKNELGQENPTIFDITKERILRAGAKIQVDNKESKKSKDLSKQDFGFKIFETLPMFNGYFDEMDELEGESEQQALFDGSQLSDEDLAVLLTSWMVNDGIKFNEKVEKITLDKYTGYYSDKKLYLMDKGFTTNDLKALLKKLDNNKDFQPNKIILFGYNFESKHQREISEALNSYTNKKQIELDRVVRY